MQIYQPTLPFYVIDNLLQGGNKKNPFITEAIKGT